MSAVPASANTIVGIIDWDTPPVTAWTARDPQVALTLGGAEDQWLQIEATDAALDVAVSGNAADLFAGTWRSEYWIELDFWADTQADSVQVRWGAGGGSTNIWGHAVTPSGGLNSWQPLRTASLGNVDDWDIGSGDPNAFLADLSSIDWIGVYIDRAGTGDERYGVDDVSLMVPEPAQLLLLAAAFGVGLLVFRRMRLVPVAG